MVLVYSTWARVTRVTEARRALAARMHRGGKSHDSQLWSPFWMRARLCTGMIMTRKMTTQPTTIVPRLLLISGQSISPAISLSPSPPETIQIGSPAWMILAHLRHLRKDPKVTWITMWSTVEVRISLQTTTLHQKIRTLIILLLPHRNQDPDLRQVKTNRISQYSWGRATLTLLGAAAHHLTLRKSWAVQVTVGSISTLTKLMSTRKLPVVIILANH